jgi:glycosyltransferase involved in cell wall biosynthesis
MSKNALIIASGLKDVRGHNLSYTKAVESELRKRNITVTVFANKNLNETIAKEKGYKAIFSHGTYDFPPGNGAARDLIYTYLQSRIYADELERALADTATKFDLTFCHTVSDFELIGWNRYLSRRRLNGHLMILQRLTPRFDSSPQWKLKLHPYWRMKPHYLNSIRSKMGGRFRLLTDSELLTKDYAHIYRDRIVTLPIPINGLVSHPEAFKQLTQNSILPRYKLERNGSICFGYMGDSRGGKGFSLLPGMIRSVLSESGSKAKFVVQCPAPEYSETKASSDLLELRKLEEQSNGKLTLIPEKLSDPDYAELLQFLDVALIPYSHKAFAEGTSNIFAEALVAGKPVIVSSGTWMAREAEKGGSGLEFRTGEVKDFAAKVLEMTRHCEEYRGKAKTFSTEWQRFHNPKTLVDILLQEAQLN